MQVNLEGQHALVTGGGTGVGAAIAVALAEAGAAVTITGRREAPLKDTADGHAKMGWAIADVTDTNALRAAFSKATDERGPVSIVVANAGVAESQPFSRLTSEQWQHTIDVNLTGVFNTFQRGLEPMLAAGRGRMIAIASVAGLRGSAYVSSYCAAKHGVIGLTRSLAAELGRKGVTVNAVCPGYTETPMLDRTLDNIVEKTGMSRDEAAASLLKGSPTGKFVQPCEIADVVLQLCADDASARNGEAIAMPEGIA
ncbi:MAG: SDR family NAD(P)-dependent oxidoreductase [Anderseniella sp.]